MADSNEGLWRKPENDGDWRKQEDEQESVGWRRVPALPDLDGESDESGWHRPDQDDTPFDEQDTLDINVRSDTPAPEDDRQADDRQADDIRPPEDMIAASDAPTADQKALLAPEDLMFQLEQLEDEEDPEKVAWSELVALQELDQDHEAEHGEDSPISPDLALSARRDDESDQFDVGMLSPAERLNIGASGDTEEVNAEVVDDDAHDPAEYARRQLEQMGTSASAAQPSAAPEELSPREIVLLKKYRDTENAVRQMRQQVQAGQMSQEDYTAALRDKMVLDDDQVWWMMGVNDDRWYQADGNNWVEATPEVFLKEQRIQQNQGDGFDSLPYLPDQQQTGTGSTYGEYSEPEGGRQYGDMPLPRQVPLDDDQATVPGRSAYRMEQTVRFDEDEPVPQGTATMPSPAHADGGTVMAEPVGYGSAGGVSSAYEQTEPPDYEYDEYDEGEVYEKARERARRSAVRNFSLVGALVAGLILLVAGGFVGMAILWYQNVANEWEERVAGLATMEREDTFQTVVLLDRDGNQIAELSRGGDVRRPVTLNEVSPYFIHALLSLSDPDFYEASEWGFTTRLGAFWSNLVAGSPEVETSPITLELARSLVLRDRQFVNEDERRMHEQVVANELTRQYTRAQLLEFYINDVLFFGNQNHGVEAATRFYFERDDLVNSAAELTYPQAALLAVITRSPTALNPITNREAALDQMRGAMQTMADVGCITFASSPLPAGGAPQLCISDSDVNSPQSALDQSRVIRYLRTQVRGTTSDFPHFVTLVQDLLQETFGEDIYRRGYRVTTTLDRGLQAQAEEALARRVAELRPNGVDTGAIMVTDPRNGAILALVGSPDYDDESVSGQEDKASTFRLPADVIKPIIYAMAFEGLDRDASGSLSPNEYITPATILWDVPTAFPDGTAIRNAGGAINGAVSARFALGNQLNIPAVKLLANFGGAERFRIYAERMGIEFAADATFRTDAALGTTEVQLNDLMQVYGAIANNGNMFELAAIESITDANNNPIPVPSNLTPQPNRVISPEVAYLLQSILSDNSARQPRFPSDSPLVVPNVRTGVMTGTSEGSRDLWTIGFSTNRVVGVWLGNNNRDPVLNNLTGFNATAPLWNQVMRNAVSGTETGSFQRPGGVLQAQGCLDTGTVPPGNNCARIGNVEFITDRRPPAPDGDESFIVTREIDTWSGLIANNNCPDNRDTRQFANIDDPTAIAWLNRTQQGQQYARRIGLPTPVEAPPTQSCDVNVVIPTARISSPQGSQTVQGEVPIRGQVGEREFRQFEVQIALEGTNDFRTITTSTSPLPEADSTLTVWDTTSYNNGAYTIRLWVRANNANDGFVYRTVSNVIVNNPEPTPTPVPTATEPPPPTDPPPPTFAPVDTPLPFDELPPADEGGGFIVPEDED
ncbi:MAG: hypothetical protein EA396_10200 [Anaerolineaceae bacterium]|nr:MAG: hypothetical protein EA396_10200 [Anaerolineaceae bacterium]